MEATPTKTKEIKATPIGRETLNKLFFYKGTDGRFHWTDEEDSSKWQPPFDPSDTDPASTINPGGEDIQGEGSETNERGNNENEGDYIDTSDPWWSTRRGTHGILSVVNLSGKITLTQVDFVLATDSSVNYHMSPVSPQKKRSIVLRTGDWNITAHYDNPAGTPQTRTITKTVAPLGIAGKINYVYFYFKNGDYHLDGTNDTPPDGYENDGGVQPPGTTPGENEGDSPGALTDNNRGSLGLVILKNLTRDKDITSANYVQTPKNFTMTPGPGSADQKSILLGPGDWSTTIHYPGGGPAGPKTVTVVTGQVSYQYFYKTNTGSYDVSTVWPPTPNNAAGDNEDPDVIIGDDEGWLHVTNSSAKGSIVDRVQYNNSGTWLDLTLPDPGYITAGNSTAPDIVLAKGTWSFRFKILGKDTYSRSVAATIRAGDHTPITYTDAMDDDLPPSGYGTLRIFNNSSWVISKVAYFRDTVGPPGTETAVGINNGGTKSLILPAPTSNSWGYIVRSYINTNTFVEHRVSIENQKITDITITGDEDTATGGGTGDGQVKITNYYHQGVGPALPVRFFKIVLAGPVTKYAGAVNAGSNPNGTLGLRTGESSVFSIPAAQEGDYTLTVTWGNLTYNAIDIKTTTIGTYYLSSGMSREIKVDLYDENMAVEAVATTIRFVHNGYSSLAAPITQVQVFYGATNNDPAVNGVLSDTQKRMVVVDAIDTIQPVAGSYIEFRLVSGRTYRVRALWSLTDNWTSAGGVGVNDWCEFIPTAGKRGILDFVLDRPDDLKYRESAM
jgi:hypothetical protein